MCLFVYKQPRIGYLEPISVQAHIDAPGALHHLFQATLLTVSFVALLRIKAPVVILKIVATPQSKL